MCHRNWMFETSPQYPCNIVDNCLVPTNLVAKMWVFVFNRVKQTNRDSFFRRFTCCTRILKALAATDDVKTVKNIFRSLELLTSTYTTKAIKGWRKKWCEKVNQGTDFAFILEWNTIKSMDYCVDRCWCHTTLESYCLDFVPPHRIGRPHSYHRLVLWATKYNSIEWIVSLQWSFSIFLNFFLRIELILSFLTFLNNLSKFNTSSEIISNRTCCTLSCNSTVRVQINRSWLASGHPGFWKYISRWFVVWPHPVLTKKI